MNLNGLQKRIEKVKIDTCIISINGDMVFKYFRNRKSTTKLFKLNSVTKSILSILIGIAIDGGDLEDVEVPISRFFPDLNVEKQSITLEHLLTMSPGLDWGEFGSWGGRPFPMINSKNWVNFVLERPMIEPPGQHMYYNSGCSHLLSAILQKSTGLSLQQYAERKLFKFLEIDDYLWHSDSSGIGIGGFGLSLKAWDMQKIGSLMLGNGIYHSRRVVSESWVSASTRRRFHTYDDIGSYGYHWWIMNDGNNEPVQPYTYFAMGYSGQYIIVSPDLGLAATFTSDMPDQTFLPLQLFKEEVFRRLV